MRFAPIAAAPLRFDAAGLPYAPLYDDIYHPAAGAQAQAEHVFLRGNGLPERWRGRASFVVLETGFGLGNNFLATWNAWRLDAQRAERLHFVSIEKHPFQRADLAALHAASPWPALADQLLQAWPVLTPDLHTLSFDAGRVQLHLAFGDAAAWLPQLVAHVHAFYLDGFAPARNPELWAPAIYKALARLALPQATLATWSAARVVRDGLRAAGFEAAPAAGSGGKRDITLAHFDPAWVPKQPLARAPRPAERRPRHALIVGAGLAGCAAAWALARQGWSCCVVDQEGTAAAQASGNPAGTFHGIVNRQDGAHARFNRAAALEAQRVIAPAVAKHGVPGSTEGLLRLDAPETNVAAMRAVLARLGLPEDYVRAVDAQEASAIAGVPLTRPGWFYPGGGWVDPARLARHWLDEAGSACEWRPHTHVAQLRRTDAGWELLGAAGNRIDAAAHVVLANAGGALELLGRPEWPLQCSRGQISLLPVEPLRHGDAAPRVALSGSGFLAPSGRGGMCFGATATPMVPGRAGLEPTFADHALNLARLRRLWEPGAAITPQDLVGRVGYRWSSADRLPLVGAVPAVGPWRLDQPRFIGREPGLFVLIGLGSRGITWAPLAAQVLAALMTGGPVPVGADLLDAIDPARFASRRFRRPGRDAQPQAAVDPLQGVA